MPENDQEPFRNHGPCFPFQIPSLSRSDDVNLRRLSHP